jgi:hypothetical protein
MMTRYLIEVEHENSKQECERAQRLFMETGSHFVTHADWGCGDDVHKAWFVVDVGSKEEAAGLLPALFRHRATVVALEKIDMQDIDGIKEQHGS